MYLVAYFLDLLCALPLGNASDREIQAYAFSVINAI